MNDYETETPPNLAHDCLIGPGGKLSESYSVPDHRDPCGLDALSDDAFAHILAQHNNSRSLPQGPAMRVFPEVAPEPPVHDSCGQSHVRLSAARVAARRA